MFIILTRVRNISPLGWRVGKNIPLKFPTFLSPTVRQGGPVSSTAFPGGHYKIIKLSHCKSSSQQFLQNLHCFQ
jgi:hypothetical protein